MNKLMGSCAAIAVSFTVSMASAQTTVAPGTPAMVKLTQAPPQAATPAPVQSATQAQQAQQTSSATTTASTAASESTGNGTEVIKNFYAQLVDTMKQGDQLGYSGRYKKLEPAVKSAFNLPLMARFAVGLDWTKATPDEQQQLVSAFSDFSVASYASQFKSFNGEAFKIVDEKPTTEGILVETSLTPKDGSAIALNYLMKPDDKGRLRVVDVFLDGAISQLAAQRSQFTSIVRRDGIPALVNSLGDKAKQMGPS